MLKLFRNSSPFSVIILLLLTIGIKFRALTHPQLPEAAEAAFLWKWILQFLSEIWGHSATAFTLVALITVLLQGLLLNRIADFGRLYHQSSLLPAVSYIILTGIIPEFNYFSAALIANWFVIIALYQVLSAQGREEVRRQLFNAGFVLALAALIYFPYAVLLLGIIIALAILTPMKASGWMITLLGFITPFYFLAGILFLTDQWSVLPAWPVGCLNYPLVFHNLSPVLLAVALLLVWGVIALLSLRGYMQKMIVSIRSAWWAIFIMAFCAAAATIWAFGNDITAWMAFLVFASLIFANPFFETGRKWLTYILFYAIIVITLWLQWFPDKIIFI